MKQASLQQIHQGFNTGITLSISNKPMKAKIKAAEPNKQAAENELAYNQSLLESQYGSNQYSNT